MKNHPIVVRSSVRKTRWSRAALVILLTWGALWIPAKTLRAQDTVGLIYAPLNETNVSEAAATAPLTRVAGWGPTTGKFIQVSGPGGSSLDVSRRGMLTLPETRGQETVISHSPSGGITIHEPGAGNTTQVTPDDYGGLRIRTGDNTQFYVTPEGTVRTYGKKNKGTFITSSRDGSTITIWGRGGRTYTIPMPQKK
jgi:hypothetical protein